MVGMSSQRGLERTIGELFTAKGRINRLKFLITYVASVTVPIWSFEVLVSAIRVGETLELLLGIATFSFVAMTLTFASIKRLHDIETTGWAALFLMVPLANVTARLSSPSR